MLSISHALTGAFIATSLPHPALYTPLVLGSHYLEDWIPHWDVGTGLSNGTRKKSTAIILELGELVLTGGLLWWLWHAAPISTQVLAGTGAVLGLLPDFIEAPRNFLRSEPGFFKPLNAFHGHFHHSTPNKILGLLPQIVLWVVIIGLVQLSK